jgi:hypothetical protein
MDLLKMTITFCLVFIFFVTLPIIQTISSFDTLIDDQIENKFDEIQQIPSSFEKSTNIPECLSKNYLLNILNRNRRASISRPYFHHWRPARDNGPYLASNSLAFSPRLRKRTYEGEKDLDEADSKFVYRPTDLDTVMNYLQEKKIDIIYEDSTKICLSQPISDVPIQQILDKIDYRRNQNEQDKEEIRERQPIGKHSIIFRYRLG